ncbi:hypothetical protein [Streptomyces sp. NBRC 110028]|uniref:hypothetical protein n=1 Tax=Streptomyces sp. NBRC 110028 TaxID=1621260 RepID=UPI0006E32377|nr:hypothetical protein [Streptomyces sp. NBRC 110028]
MSESADTWEFRTRLALAERSVGDDVSDSLLAEVAAHCAESGESPEEVFGRPDDFAESVAAERLPADAGAGGDPDAWTRTDYAFAVTAQWGLMAFMAGAYALVTSGLMADVTAAALIGCAAVATAVAALYGARFALHSGSRVRATACAVGALVAIVLAAVAFVEGPHTVIAPVPTPALCALGVALPAWALFSRPSATAAPAPERLSSEAWLRKLPQLLRGRHALPRTRAAELTREAGRHLAETGSEPEEEFGPVAAYARRLARAEAPRQHWWQRNDVREAISTALFGTYLLNNLHRHGPVWLSVVAAVGTYAGAATLIGHVRRKVKRDRRAAT